MSQSQRTFAVYDDKELVCVGIIGSNGSMFRATTEHLSVDECDRIYSASNNAKMVAFHPNSQNWPTDVSEFKTKTGYLVRFDITPPLRGDG
jgi:hypothetical protein